MAHEISADCREIIERKWDYSDPRILFSLSCFQLAFIIHRFFLFFSCLLFNSLCERAQQGEERKILAILVPRARCVCASVCVCVSGATKPNFRIIPRNFVFLFSAVFIARKEGQSFVQLFLLLPPSHSLSRFCCALFIGEAEERGEN